MIQQPHLPNTSENATATIEKKNLNILGCCQNTSHDMQGHYLKVKYFLSLNDFQRKTKIPAYCHVLIQQLESLKTAKMHLVD